MGNNITSHNNMNHSSVRPLTVMVNHYLSMFARGVVHIILACYNVDHYCLMFDRGVVHIVVIGDIVDHYC
jgi:hypothetical protein